MPNMGTGHLYNSPVLSPLETPFNSMGMDKSFGASTYRIDDSVFSPQDSPRSVGDSIVSIPSPADDSYSHVHWLYSGSTGLSQQKMFAEPHSDLNFESAFSFPINSFQ